ncbi:hypothetical protein M8J77_015877 [Diaphorina citri]|nr:hypothetical protein M8J77_015877 [Diaphorina citri]
MNNFLVKFNHLKKNRTFRFGVPFIVLVVGSSFGLREFTTLRYEFRRNESLSPAALKEIGIQRKPASESTLEKLYEKEKDVDLDNWTNIRGPRPWEDMSVIEKMKEENLAKKKKKLAES